MVVHAHNPTESLRQDYCEFKASLGYIETLPQKTKIKQITKG
jgi:hypothetical protein